MHVYWIFQGARNSIQNPVQHQKHCSHFEALTKLLIPLVPVPHTGVRLALTNNKQVQVNCVSMYVVYLSSL